MVQPTITLPTPVTETAGPASDRAEPAARPAPRAAAPATRSVNASQPAAPIAAPVPQAAAPVAAMPMNPTPVAPQATPDSMAQPAVPPPPADTTGQAGAEASGNNDMLLAAGGIAALLLALGIGGGYVATRARRRRRVEKRLEIYETVPAQAYAPPAPTREPAAPLPAFSTVEGVADRTVIHDRDTALRIGSDELVPATASAGAVPRTRDERDAMLDRMVADEPSAENPFTSRKARLRRARIILQSREIDARKEADKPFDWRTYKSEARNPAPATPPRVTA